MPIPIAPRPCAALAALVASACFSPDDGIEPPLDQLYFPVNLTSDASGRHLFVANSNFDLQFNGGTVQSFDLERIRAMAPLSCTSDEACAGIGRCHPEQRWCVPDSGPFADQACGPLGEKSAADALIAPGRCGGVDPRSPPDGLGSLVIDAVGVGAFATDMIFRQAPPDAVAAPSGRLFLPVRGDNTLHWIDVDAEGRLECGQAANDGDCDDDHRRGDDPQEESTRGAQLPREPFGIDATGDGRAIVVTHQLDGLVSLFVNDWSPRGPRLEYILGNLPLRPIGVAAIPVPALAGVREIPYDPGFYVTFRDAPQVQILRFLDDAGASPDRPFLNSVGSVGIPTNSVGFDSRGIAIDAEERQACEARCLDDVDCLTDCSGVPLRLYVANRTPSSLLMGVTLPEQSPSSSGDRPRFNDSEPMPFGPSRVRVGKVINRDGELETRVFLVCFDTRSIVPFDPLSGEVEEAFAVGRGPHAFYTDVSTDMATGQRRALGYAGHFTDSYIGVIELDQRSKNYGTIVLTVGIPTPPRAAQ